MYDLSLMHEIRHTLARRNGERYALRLQIGQAYGRALSAAERDELGICARIARASRTAASTASRFTA